MCPKDEQTLHIKGKSPMHHKRVKWLIGHLDKVKGRSSYTVAEMMIKDGLYSPKSNKKDAAFTIESMLEYITKNNLG